MHRISKFIWFVLVIGTAFYASLSYAVQEENGPIRVTFISPSLSATRPFWADYTAFMMVAAESLGIDLVVLESRNRHDVMSKAEDVLSQPNKPDYLICIYQRNTTLHILSLAEAAGVRSIITNTDIIPSERVDVGHPRGKFSRWIGHIFPDDVLAGSQLADRLIQQALNLDMLDQDGRLHLVALGGNRAATSALYREEGLRQALDAHSKTELDRFILANWKRTEAKEKTLRLLEMYPKAKVWWAVNDNTTFGILDAADEYGLVPGKDIVTGGIDWSIGGIRAVEDGRMVLTLGGHFMEGAWALIMALDHYSGHDFATPNPTLHSEMRLIDRTTLARYLPALDRSNWTRIDFKQFSRTYNPDLKAYDFNPDAVVRALEAQ